MTFYSTTGIISSSPELPQTTLSVSASSSSSSPTTTTLSSFPLPYRSQSATHYRSPSSEYPPATFLLTSQDFRPYHSPPTPTLPGRFSSPDDSRPSTSSAGLPNSYESESNPNTGSFSSPNWQPRDSKWPQSRSQSSRKYIPKGRRYDSPINQRRMAHGMVSFIPRRRAPCQVLIRLLKEKSRMAGGRGSMNWRRDAMMTRPRQRGLAWSTMRYQQALITAKKKGLPALKKPL